MKIQKPAETVEICDFCGRDGYLQACDVCRRQYCLSDTAIVPGSYGFLNMCRECGEREDVKEICHRYSRQLFPIFQRRNAALKRLNKKAK